VGIGYIASNALVVNGLKVALILFFSTCPSEPKKCTKKDMHNSRNAHILYGALVAGPGRFGR